VPTHNNMNLKFEAEDSAMRIAPMCVKEMTTPSPSTVPLAHRMGEGSGMRAMESGERADQEAKKLPILQSAFRNPRFQARFVQFIKFCLVGGSGVVVDMGILYLLADPSRLGWSITLSKICAALVALTNNFIWNELWTFKSSTLSASTDVPRSRERERVAEGRVRDVREKHSSQERVRVRADQDGDTNPQSAIRVSHFGWLTRFLLFNAICGIGIGLAVLLLHLFHTWLGWNLYLSNLLAIVLVTFWNYGMNAKFSWRREKD